MKKKISKVKIGKKKTRASGNREVLDKDSAVDNIREIDEEKNRPPGVY